MNHLTSRQKILFGVYAMILAIIGDYLLGFGTISTSTSPDAYMGMTFNVVGDWRYALSSILGFISSPLFAIGAIELFKVMENKYALKEKKLYKLFKLANWGGILYFTFIHIGICMFPVVFNAGMSATGDLKTSVDMAFRVAKSIAVPLGLSLLICDGFVTIGWVGMVFKGYLPVQKIAFICNPVMMLLIGQLTNLIMEGLDSGSESFGWLLMYLVCAYQLVNKTEKIEG